MLHRHHQQWEKVVGRVVSIEVVHKRPSMNPKIVTVELHPDGQQPVRAELHLDPLDRHWNDDTFFPLEGEVRGFLYDPASGEVQLDMDDPRNSQKARESDLDRLMAEADEEDPQPAAPGENVTGPPWIVPATCPNCSAPVDQATMAMETDPRCAYCHQPLPAQPRSRF
jgi:hypothetical protein